MKGALGGNPAEETGKSKQQLFFTSSLINLRSFLHLGNMYFKKKIGRSCCLSLSAVILSLF